MSIQVEDMMGTVRVVDAAGLEAALARRCGNGVNEFWISHDQDRFPVLAIVVNGDLASLSYFPEDGHPGYKSMGDVPGLASGESTRFYVNTPTEIHLVLNDFVVPVATAVQAAQQFRVAKDRPPVVEWWEL